MGFPRGVSLSRVGPAERGAHPRDPRWGPQVQRAGSDLASQSSLCNEAPMRILGNSLGGAPLIGNIAGLLYQISDRRAGCLRIRRGAALEAPPGSPFSGPGPLSALPREAAKSTTSLWFCELFRPVFKRGGFWEPPELAVGVKVRAVLETESLNLAVKSSVLLKLVLLAAPHLKKKRGGYWNRYGYTHSSRLQAAFYSLSRTDAERGCPSGQALSLQGGPRKHELWTRIYARSCISPHQPYIIEIPPLEAARAIRSRRHPSFSSEIIGT